MPKTGPDIGKPLKGKLTFDFAKAVRAAIRDYPAQLAATAFIDGDNSAVVADTFADSEKGQIAHLKEVGQFGAKYHEQIDDGTCAFAWNSEDGKSRFMFYRRPTAERNPMEMPDLAMAGAAVFDHELGHMVVKRGMGNDAHQPQMCESVADAFASIRNFQRFGQKPEALSSYSGMRAYEFFLGQESHLTTTVVDGIRLDAESVKFMSLSPAETAALAEEYAKNLSPATQELVEARRVYRAVIEAQEKDGLDCEALAKTMLQQPANSLAFKLGARALDYLVKMDPEYFNTPEWQSLRDQIKERVDALGPSGSVLMDSGNGKNSAASDASEHTPAAPHPKRPSS